MTVMPPEVDKDLTILENLDFDIACNMNTSPCSNTVIWQVESRCCASMWFGCEHHRKILLEFLKTAPLVNCKVCSYTWCPRDVINYDWTRL